MFIKPRFYSINATYKAERLQHLLNFKPAK